MSFETHVQSWSLSPDGSERAIILHGPSEDKIEFRSTSTGQTHAAEFSGPGHQRLVIFNRKSWLHPTISV
jgi:hypothetical protein